MSRVRHLFFRKYATGSSYFKLILREFLRRLRLFMSKARELLEKNNSEGIEIEAAISFAWGHCFLHKAEMWTNIFTGTHKLRGGGNQRVVNFPSEKTSRSLSIISASRRPRQISYRSYSSIQRRRSGVSKAKDSVPSESSRTVWLRTF